MSWDTNYAIGRFLNRIGAIKKDGEVLAPCPFFDSAHSGSNPYKVVLSRGTVRPLIWHCRVCGYAMTMEIGEQWGIVGVGEDPTAKWLKEADAGGYQPLYAAEINREPLPSLGTLDSAYRYLLVSNPVSNSEPALKWLERRGLSKEQALELGYGWFPGEIKWAERMIKEVAAELAELACEAGTDDIPGLLYPENLRGPAIAIPCRAENGMIHGIKLRLLREGSGKMRQLSSPPEVKAQLDLHFAGDFRKQRPIVLTEGERKADIVTLRMPGYNAIGVPGVGTVGKVLDWLDSTGRPGGAGKRASPVPSELILAFDTDFEGKKCHAAAASLLHQKLAEYRAKGGEGGDRSATLLKEAKWSGYKGIDEALVSGAEVSIGPLPTPSVLQVVTTPTLADIESVLSEGPVWLADFDKRHPRLHAKTRAAIRQKQIQFRKFAGSGPAIALNSTTEEEWKQWIASLSERSRQ